MRDRYLSYWKTVWMVMFRPVQFCEQYAHILSLSDARWFRLVTVLHAYLPIMVATLYLYATRPVVPEVSNPVQQWISGGGAMSGPTFVDRAYAEVWPVVILHICFVLFLITATGIPSYFFRPRSVALQQQKNAAAMSLYACAPLALYPVIALVICIMALIVDLWGFAHMVAASSWPAIGFYVTPCVCVFAWYWSLLRLVQRIMPLLRQRHVSVGVLLPFVWLGLAGIMLGLIPLLVLYVLIILVSLTG